jgi:rhamnose utilization protein RhaD (predicted bifunctional aldolase and dehydrogenase)
MTTQNGLRFLEDRWDEAVAAKLDAPELLRYRSNLLGSDLEDYELRWGNPSSKLGQIDPLDGMAKQVLWVKGIAGDLRSIKRMGFAMHYFGEVDGAREGVPRRGPGDEMVEMYPLCTFGNSSVFASIDTRLHGLLSYPRVDHLHPD